MESGTVFDIQHFAIHDGPGIRTTVFLKGCPLHCLWCHNPESQATQVEIFFSPEKCIGCRYCEDACTRGLHSFTEGEEPGTLVHTFEREGCTGCGDCARECFAGALEMVGETMSTDAVLTQVLRDRAFYENSGGGITLSGGEPMQQFAFTRELLAQAKLAGLHTCIETCGASTSERYLSILPDVDLFYFDIKETDEALHRAYTGVTNRVILDNLFAIDRAGARIVLRCPVIPGLNDRDSHFAAVAGIANRLQGVQAVQVLPYHPLGTNKNQRLGKLLPFEPPARPSDAQVNQWVAEIQKNTRVPVTRS